MVELTKFEDKLIDNMQEAFDEASKGVSLLRMFISNYDFDMRKASESALHYIQGNWDTAGQVLYAITDYFESIEEILGRVLLADSITALKIECSEPQTQQEEIMTKLSEKNKLLCSSVNMLCEIKREDVQKYLNNTISAAYKEVCHE